MDLELSCRMVRSELSVGSLHGADFTEITAPLTSPSLTNDALTLCFLQSDTTSAQRVE